MDIRNFSDVKSLLFDNRTINQTIFKNTFWLFLAKGAGILTMILTIFAARILGPTEFGKFSFALAFVLMLAIFSDLGISSITTRELAKEEEKQKEYPAILSLKIILTIFTLVLMIFCSLLITRDPFTRKIIFILVIYSLIESFGEIIFAALRAFQKMEYEAIFSIFRSILLCGTGLLILFYFPSVENLSYSYLFVAFIVLLLVLLFFHFRIQALKLDWNRKIWQKFLRLSWPLALAAIFSALYMYINLVMMGYWGQITQTGWYNAAYRIINIAVIPVALIAQSFYPALSKFFIESKEKLQNIWDLLMKLMIILAIPLMIGGLSLASKIINFLYGSSFWPAIFVFQILILSAGIGFLTSPYVQMLIVVNQQKKVFYITMIGGVMNIILNLFLIPRYSLYGAAVATLITSFVIFVLYLFFVKYFTSATPFNLQLTKILIFAIFASGLMYSITKQPFVYNLNVILIIIIGMLIYSVAIFVFHSLENLLKRKYNYNIIINNKK